MLGVVLRAERVIEEVARPPAEPDAQLPLRVGEAVEVRQRDVQVVVEVARDEGGRALADADDADVLGPEDGDGQLRDLGLQRDRRQKPSAAAAHDEYLLNHDASCRPVPHPRDRGHRTDQDW